MTTLTAAQQAAVNTRAPRVALLAAPGSGKTRTLIERAVSLILEGSHPSELLLVTFTRNAAAEMRSRLVERLAADNVRGAHAVTVSTFHSIAAKLLREWADKLGLDPRFTIRDDGDRTDLALYCGEELGLFKGKRPTADMDDAGRKRRAQAAMKRPDVLAAYARHMQEAHALDYDGLQSHLLRLLQLPEVADQLRRRWLHVLVDETQDTSSEQQAILDALAPRNLFVVGDTSQAIYSFRGAHPGGFVELTERPGWEVLKLSTNFRSRRPVVDAATRLGRHMAVPGLDQDAGRADADEDAGHVLRTLDLPAGIEQWAPFLVASLQQVGAAVGGDWNDCAILSPTWRELDRLAPYLEAAGIPARSSRKVGDVWASLSMRWIRDGLRVAANAHDYLALYGYMNRLSVRLPFGAWSGIRASAIAAGEPIALAVRRRSAGTVWNMADVLDFPDGNAGAEDVTTIAAAVALTLEGVVRAEHLDSRAEELAAAVAAIKTWAAAQPDGERTVSALLDAMSEDLVAPASDEEPPPGLTLSTIHGAKGLEWRAVWVLACEEGVMPRGDGNEEERRLFYVALTRAADRCRLVWRADRTRSRFVGEATGDSVGPCVVGGGAVELF